VEPTAVWHSPSIVKVYVPPAAADGEVQVVVLVSSIAVMVFPLTEKRMATFEFVRLAAVLQPVETIEVE